MSLAPPKVVDACSVRAKICKTHWGSAMCPDKSGFDNTTARKVSIDGSAKSNFEGEVGKEEKYPNQHESQPKYLTHGRRWMHGKQTEQHKESSNRITLLLLPAPNYRASHDVSTPPACKQHAPQSKVIDTTQKTNTCSNSTAPRGSDHTSEDTIVF